jgi:hypothetical protein
MDFTVTISDMNMKILANELLDVDDWIQMAMDGKLQSVKTRMIADWHIKLLADPDVESIPAHDDALINMVLARDDYKTAVQREAEEAAKRPSP